MVKRKAQSTLGFKVLKRSRTYPVRSRSSAVKGRIHRASARRLIAPLAKDPFPAEWRTKMTWSPETYLLAPGTTNGAVVVRTNDLYDPDFSNVFGNGQPLFTDQVMSATGPYQLFKVNSWKCKVTLKNASGSGGGSSGALPLDCYIVQGSINSTDVDTFDEIKNSAGRLSFLLDERTGSGSMVTRYINGSADAYTPGPTSADIDYCGTFSASPAKPLFLGIGVKNAYSGDAGTIQCFIKIEIEYDVTFFNRDAIAS